jgi:hypothetical protein
MCVAPIRAGACNTLSHRRMPENCGDTNTISFTCLRFRSFSKGGLVFVNSQNHLRCREPEATLLFGYLFELARKKQPSLGSVAKLCPAVSNISCGLHQFFGGLLSALLRCKNHGRIRSGAPSPVWSEQATSPAKATLLGMQGCFLRFKLGYKLGYCVTRLLVAGLSPEPLIAVDGLVDRVCTARTWARRWIRREHAALSVTDNCRGPVDDAG